MTDTTSRAAGSSQRRLAHLGMLLFAALIAGSFTFGAAAVPYLAPVPLNALRFVMASLLMGAFAFGVARQKFAWPKAPWRFGITGFLTAVYFVTMFIALTMTLPVATSAVYTLVPIMTALTGLLIVGQRSGPPVLLSLLLAGIGAIWVIFRGDLDALLRFDIGTGELIYFVGCIAYAIYTPLLRRYNRGESALVLSFWTLTGTALCIVLYGLPEILATDWLHPATRRLVGGGLPRGRADSDLLLPHPVRLGAPAGGQGGGLWLHRAGLRHRVRRICRPRLDQPVGRRRSGDHGARSCGAGGAAGAELARAAPLRPGKRQAESKEGDNDQGQEKDRFGRHRAGSSVGSRKRTMSGAARC